MARPRRAGAGPGALPPVRLRVRRDLPKAETLGPDQLERMQEAAEQLSEQMIVWARRGESAVSLALAGQLAEEWTQYPPRDGQDASAFRPYFYHCHPQAQTPRQEHGHFHLFVERAAAPGTPAYSHLIALAVDGRGLPKRLFTTNRWVTGEQWSSAQSLLQEPWRSTASPEFDDAIGAWLQNVLRLFSPQLDALLRRRDERTLAWLDADFEDRRRHVLSDCSIDLMAQIRCVTAL